jgi:rhamnogalacturonan endolyase
MHIKSSPAILLALSQGANAAFGFISTTKSFKVDTDSGLTFEINKYVTTCLC